MKYCIAYTNDNGDIAKRKLFIPLGIDEQKQVDKFNQIKAENHSVELHYHAEDVSCNG